MLYVYIGCLAFGIFYAAVSAVFGSHDFGSHDFGHFEHGGIHAESGDSADTPSPFSPLVIASAITAFGAVGIIGKIGFGMGELLSSVFALVFAGIVGAIIFFGVVKVMYASQSNSTFSQEDLTGIEAEVLTPIPGKGMGEIAYVINGVRCSLPAKSLNSQEIARGEVVIVKEVSGNIASVTRKITIDNYDTMEFDDNRSKGNFEENKNN